MSHPHPNLTEKQKKYLGAAALAVFLLFCLLVHAFWRPGADLLATLLLGEGYAEILSALEQTAEASRQGIPLREAAVGAFREMLHGG